MSNPPLYIRVKRRNQTYCLLCAPSDSIASIKKKISAILQQHPLDGSKSDNNNDDNDNHNTTDNSNMQLWLEHDHETTLEDDDTLQQHEIKDNAVLHVVFAVGEDEYESVDITSTEDDPMAAAATTTTTTGS